MYYFYILQMSDDRLYVGITDNLQRRQAQYNHGDFATRTTRIFGAGTMLYYEKLPDLKSALKRNDKLRNGRTARRWLWFKEI